MAAPSRIRPSGAGARESSDRFAAARVGAARESSDRLVASVGASTRSAAGAEATEGADESLEELAKTLGRVEFARVFREIPFLVRRAERAPASQAASNATYSYHTALVEAPVLEGSQLFVAVPVRKRAGNPFPERISVGRAPNCDLVVRSPHASKLHAHFVRADDGSWTVLDNASTYGTFVNGVRLEPRQPCRVVLGDSLQLAFLEVEWTDAHEAHRALTEASRKLGR